MQSVLLSINVHGTELDPRISSNASNCSLLDVIRNRFCESNPDCFLSPESLSGPTGISGITNGSGEHGYHQTFFEIKELIKNQIIKVGDHSTLTDIVLSSHSRGGAIDLTIISFPPSKQEPFNVESQWDCSEGNYSLKRDNSLDMGSGYDCFHEISHTNSMIINSQQRANRLLLKSLMEKYGFKNYYKEWWHYNFIDETFPETYFNFPVD